MSEGRKLSMSNRGTLGASKGVETGKVRQSFSHGRSKPVVVERKRRKLVKKEDGATPTVEKEAPVVATPPQTEAEASLTSSERDTRAEALKEAIRQAEAERMKASEAKREREVGEVKEREEVAREAAERRASEAAKAKRKAEEEAEQKIAEAEQAAVEASTQVEDDARKKKRELEARKLKEEEEARQRKKDDEKKTASRRVIKGDERRRSGKLTVANALSGGDGPRPRSLAALKRAQAKKRQGSAADSGAKRPREVIVPENITVQEFANRMAERAAEVIKVLMNMGVLATINESIDQDTAELVATELGHTIKRVSESDVEIGLVGEEDVTENMQPRAPVIAVMGHVDHGKTSLLDALRKTDVVAGEAGGITQHIGAYQVHMEDGQVITFLDTPGHEAFTQMRQRGAHATDLVILVVAADDGIMPQTIEAIHHAKAAEVPMIVAINKMDRDGADPDRVRNELLQHEVIVEKFSGDTLDVEISALKGTGLKKLEETILLQAELLELKANPDRSAEGVVIEAKLDKGRGPVATLLVSRGTLNVGDIVVAGPEWGKARALVNDRSENVEQAGPSTPVEILGLSGSPAAGDDFAVVDSEARAREIVSYRRDQIRKKRSMTAAVSIENMFTALKDSEVDELPVVIKADVQGSAEAIVQALEKLGNEEIRARVLHVGVGGITESDVSLAAASKAPVIGFNVRANAQARKSAADEGVAIQYFSVIYDLVDHIRAAMEGRLPPAFDEETIGLAEVKDVFSAGKAGKAAGCIVLDGVARAGVKVRILRDDVVVYEGEVDSLRRFKDDVKEVKAGTECGVTFVNHMDIKAGDNLEFYELIEKERKL